MLNTSVCSTSFKLKNLATYIAMHCNPQTHVFISNMYACSYDCTYVCSQLWFIKLPFFITLRMPSRYIANSVCV